MNTFFEGRILPVVALEEEGRALSVASALREGGLNVMEIPFRTPSAAESIATIRKNTEGMYVGAGTILSSRQVREAKEAGAQFGLAPGLNANVVTEAQRLDFPFIPGVSTPSEVEEALDLGCKILKAFPIELMGGADVIDAWAGPYSHTGVQFIPMGGVDTSNMESYLRCESVIAVGGSWLANRSAIASGDLKGIAANAGKALTVAEACL